MTDPCDMNDLITVEKENASFALITESDCPQSARCSARGKTHRLEAISGDDVTRAVGPTAQAEHTAGDDRERLSIDSA
jgi:hypothetical protein